jgi:hypothetical protein
MNKNHFCSVSKKKKKLLSMLSKAYFSLLTIFCKIGYMFCPSQFYIFFLGRVANVCSGREVLGAVGGPQARQGDAGRTWWAIGEAGRR